MSQEEILEVMKKKRVVTFKDLKNRVNSNRANIYKCLKRLVRNGEIIAIKKIIKSKGRGRKEILTWRIIRQNGNS